MAVDWWACSIRSNWENPPSKRVKKNLKNPLSDHLRGELSDGSQPPMTFDLSLSESAGSRSLHRLRHFLSCFSNTLRVARWQATCTAQQGTILSSPAQVKVCQRGRDSGQCRRPAMLSGN